MFWLIFPGIFLYFLIGGMLADAFRTDLEENDVESALWFILWPIMFAVVVVIFVAYLVVSLFSCVIFLLRKTFRCFRPRGKRPNAS